jgi:gliding motility-associated-like protein
MGPGDTAVCGLEYEFLRAELPGDGITGMWYEESPLTMFGPQNAAITSPTAPASVTSYGRHEYYWILYALVEGQDPSFCTDTAGPWHIDFIQQPTAQIAETEHTFCGYYGELSELHVSSSVGTGTWSSSVSQNIVSFNEANNPGTIVNTTILNSNNTQYPYFDLYWTVANTQYCTAADTVRVIFAKIPSGEFTVIPPKCFGEPAIITATDRTLPIYTWEYPGAIGDSTVSNTNGGDYQMFIHWDKDNMLANGDSVHNVTLVTTNEWGCPSAMGSLNISEPRLLEYTPTIMGDICGAGTGYVQFVDTTISFIWIDTVAGNYPITAVDSFRVSNLREGEYSYITTYQTFNTNYRVQYYQYFHNERCVDTLTVEVPRTGDINLSISVNGVDLDGLVAPQQITFTVDTTGDGNRIPYVWMWDYDDGTQPRTSSSFASGAQHSYQEAGEFHPTLTVWVETDPKCRAEAVFDLDIKEKSEIDVPNIFSPNGDNINDYFQVKVKPNTISKFHGTILNRYGRVVFEWEDCYTETAGWDGKLNGSTKATPGVYYYIIDAEGIDGQTFEKRGALQLVKE